MDKESSMTISECTPDSYENGISTEYKIVIKFTTDQPDGT